MEPRRAARPALALLATAALLLPALAAGPAAAQPPRVEKAEAELAAERTAYEPGSTAELVLGMTIDPGWHTNSHEPTEEWLIPTELELELPDGWGEPEIAYPEGVMRKFDFAPDPISVYEGRERLWIELPVPADAAAGEVPVTARLRYQACDHKSCLPPVTSEAAGTLVVGPGGEPAGSALFEDGWDDDGDGHGAGSAAAGDDGAAGGEGGSAVASVPTPDVVADADDEGIASGLAWMLLLGVAGGLILNVMPCVLPVLSLKVFGMVESAGRGRREVTVGSLATAAGILVSFWALAGAAVLAKAAGAAVGWGVHFQHPGFVTFLAVVVVLFCLNLWGVFEVPLPWRLAQAAGAQGEGLAGHFGAGLFATLMATPCSAPFLGTAVAFGLAQPAWIVFAVFTAVGLGMALPFLWLAAAPGTVRWLPKPGPWMEHLKTAMGFLLAGAAVWLFFVLAGQISSAALAAVELGLLVLALFVWLRSAVVKRPAARAAALVGALGSAVFVLWAGAAPPATEAIEWVEFERSEVDRMAAQGELVFVDVTADWCLTCKVNERRVLADETVAEAFARHGVVPVKADWTNADPEIGDFLAEFGKKAIPFYVLYRPEDEPVVFGEILSRRALLEAVEGAGARVAQIERE